MTTLNTAWHVCPMKHQETDVPTLNCFLPAFFIVLYLFTDILDDGTFYFILYFYNPYTFILFIDVFLVYYFQYALIVLNLFHLLLFYL